MPEVPTLKESGIDLVADGWYGMWLPAGSPPDFAAKLSAAAVATMAKPEVQEKLTAQWIGRCLQEAKHLPSPGSSA